MRTIQLVSFLLLALFGSAQAQDVTITNIQNRTSTNLNGKWKYILDQYETGQIGFMPLYKNAKPQEQKRSGRV